MICEKCLCDHDGLYATGRFCSSKCSRSFSTSKNRQEITQKMIKTCREIGRFRGPDEFLVRNCRLCKKDFNVPKGRNCFLCSDDCRNKSFSAKQSRLGRRGGLKSAQSQNRRSRNEIRFAELCKEKFQNVLTNEAIFNGWDADVILQDQKIAVLWNGKWHYEKLGRKHHLAQVQNRDKIKLEEIAKAGFIAHVIQDLGSEDSLFVDEKFSDFLKTFNLGEVKKFVSASI